MHSSRQVMPQTAEFRMTVEDDPKVADDPLSVLDQEVLDHVLDVALQLRRPRRPEQALQATWI
jgi:hypothetical protein